MNKIVILDSEHISSYEYNLRLKKIYNINLLNFFPTVLKSLIREYIDDIINVKMIKHRLSYSIFITDQYINYVSISLTFAIIYQNNEYSLLIHKISNNIATIPITCVLSYPYVLVLNTYMKKFYNIDNYLNMTLFNNPVEKYNTICNQNILVCWIEYSYYTNNILCIEINDNRLFKNILCIIKCISMNLGLTEVVH